MNRTGATTKSLGSFSTTLSSRYIPNLTEATSSSDESGAESTATSSDSQLNGFRDWSNWRTSLNETIIKTIQQDRDQYSGNPKMSIQRNLSDFAVSAVARDHAMSFSRPELQDLESLLSFGIPRANLHEKRSEPKKSLYKKKRQRGNVRWH